MALAMCSVNIISRGKGQSAVASAAYRSSSKIWNERDNCYNDYTRKKGVVYSEILLPPDAPLWMRERPKLWNGAEGVEVRDDARLAKDVVIALPNELTQKQSIELAGDFAKTLVAQGMVADLSVHDTGDGNPHAHIMVATRGVDGDGFSKKKNREWDSKDFLIKLRQEYERLTNEYLERYGHKERIDVRSYAEQGIDRMPTLHLGPAAYQMEKKGIRTRLGDRNREIEEQNKKLEEVNRQIDECRKEAEQIRDEVAHKEKQRQEEFEKQGAEAQEHFRPESASTKYDRLLEHYAQAAQAVQETTEALQYRLTEKGKQDLAGQEQKIESVRERLRQQTQEPDIPARGTQSKREKQKRQDDFMRLYEVPREQLPDTTPLHTRVEESERKRRHPSGSMDIVPQSSPQDSPTHHPESERSGQKREFNFEDYYPPHHQREEREPEQEKEKDNGNDHTK